MTTLETERLILRPFREGDIPAYATPRARPVNIRHLPGGLSRQPVARQPIARQPSARQPVARRVAEATVPMFADCWRAQGYGPWAVELKATGALIGHLGLRFLNQFEQAELLYLLDKSVWGRGFAT